MGECRDECCETCAFCFPLELWDFGNIGQDRWKFPEEGYVCTVFTHIHDGGEQKVVHKIGAPARYGMCELYVPKEEVK